MSKEKEVIRLDVSGDVPTPQSNYKLRGLGSVPHKYIERTLPQKLWNRDVKDATIEDLVNFLVEQPLESDMERSVMSSIRGAMTARDGINYMCVAYRNGDASKPETLTPEQWNTAKMADYINPENVCSLQIVDDASGGY
ncbi:MAG: hypothetical protein JSW73_00595 [Candidatus Woesearchaeota archaeon]|nr:MAG: hypothetical protein JSW73_00595 [Candidatus Woesearchaeota archaeon]